MKIAYNTVNASCGIVVKSKTYFRGDELYPGGDAGGGEEVGEDVGDCSQPTQAGAEDEVYLLLMLMVTLRIKLRIKLRMLLWIMLVPCRKEGDNKLIDLELSLVNAEHALKSAEERHREEVCSYFACFFSHELFTLPRWRTSRAGSSSSSKSFSTPGTELRTSRCLWASCRSKSKP